MAPLLYKADASAPCRAVMMLAKALEVELEFKDVNLLEKEHLDADFMEMNPQHSVPVLDDEGFIICDSHAILMYLIRKYSGEDTYYPDDVKERAIIDHKLFFNSGVLQSILGKILHPMIAGHEKAISEQNVDRAIEVYGFLETFVTEQDWMAGDSVTIADIAMIPTVTTMNILVPIDADIYPKVNEWMSRCEELPYYEANAEGLDIFKALYENIMSS